MSDSPLIDRVGTLGHFRQESLIRLLLNHADGKMRRKVMEEQPLTYAHLYPGARDTVIEVITSALEG